MSKITNEVKVIGRISSINDSSPKATFISVAVDEGYTGKDGKWVDRAVFIPLAAFEKEAKRLKAYKLEVGDEVVVSGHISIRKVEGGHDAVQLIADDFVRLQKKRKTSEVKEEEK